MKVNLLYFDVITVLSGIALLRESKLAIFMLRTL